ncbi:MAG TPA: hypothetical protein VFL12_01665 [Thermoanaerobaculia bacterium]|nr:hypothetical protein [Thermoanaerobaculia bacterium]
MRRRAAVAFLLVLLAASAEEAGKDRAFVLRAAGQRVRVVVPKRFEPLLPGSVYPNRRIPATRGGAPVVVLERTLAKRAEAPLLDRGFVVAEMERIDRAAIEALLPELARRVGASFGGAKLLARRAGDGLRAPEIDAAALFDPGEVPEERPTAFPCLPIAVFRRTPDGAVPAASRDGACVVERWFRTDGDFPDDAFRDAAEWLAVSSHAPD